VKHPPLLLLIPFLLVAGRLPAQTLYEYKRSDADVLFFDKNSSQHIPSIIRKYESGKAIHTGIWNNDTTGKAAIQPPMIMLMDWSDDGNAGVTSIPKNIISMYMAPMNFSYFVSPSTERYHNLFRHEYTHTVMSDKTAKQDRFWRTALGGKFTVEPTHPFSAIWSYLSAPRWYVPRWYQEGIACFMETWLCGGVGRALGGYDEMCFRSMIDSGKDLFSVVGLETGGTVSDFQGGVNSYLYGTRFVNYLELEYGLDKLIKFYNRTEDSKALINRQFENTYGIGLRKAWNDWIAYEGKHQKEQLEAIEEYPVTKTEQLSPEPMGSMAPMVLDEENNCAYTAVLCPGSFPHIERIDLKTLKRTKIHLVDDPQMYITCYLTLDKKRQRLIWTTQNNSFRGICVYDLKKKKVVKKLKFQRTSELVYDDKRDCLYGLMTSQGRLYLVRYDSELKDRTILYTFNFGVSVFDLAVSHKGDKLSCVISGDNGEQSLVMFNVDDLESARLKFETIYVADDFNLGQFRFAPDDKSMIGSSYFTGVSNIWSLDLETRNLSLLSNTRIGLFAPAVLNDTTMLACEFGKGGFRPVTFKPEVLNDANAIEMLGQKAYEKHSKELDELGISKVPTPEISFGEVYDSIKVYKPIKNLKFTGAYPELSGFTDKQAFNNVTPVLAYRFLFQDPLGLSRLKMNIGLSPWSNNDPVNQYHAQVEWEFWSWTFKAAWNPTSFYDLVGPIRTSRKGWQVTVAYDKEYSLQAPVRHSYGAQISAYGMMDALPLYQEIEIKDVTSFQTAAAYYEFRKTYNSLGAVMAEGGVIAGADLATYLVDGTFYPYAQVNLDLGLPIPILRNTCFWLRSAVGQNFGDPSTVFGKEYFGGFGNNWIDYRSANRYRDVSKFAGKPIDDISAHSFGRVMGELSLSPIRYNKIGAVNIYPTYTQFNVFSTALFTNPWEPNMGRGTFVNVGLQVNTEVVLFKFLKTTWSIGYARAFNPDGTSQGDWLISLKLL